MMMAFAELRGKAGVSVGRAAEYLHVAPAFVTVEAGKLILKDYIEMPDSEINSVRPTRSAGK